MTGVSWVVRLLSVFSKGRKATSFIDGLGSRSSAGWVSTEAYASTYIHRRLWSGLV